jgi:hypothetical protein
MEEESSIPRHPIDPHDPVVATSFGGVIFPLERVHRKGGWRRLVDEVEQRRYLISTLASEGERRQRGGGVDGVGRVREFEGRRLPAIGGSGGGRRGQREQRLRSYFVIFGPVAGTR